MEKLYVLKLEGDRYYVGKTTDVEKRVKEHAVGNGAGYTRLYKPTRVVEVRTLKSAQDENNLTREYMEKYGVDKVRGGSYSQVKLPSDTKRVLETEFRGNSNACFKCGNVGHFMSTCGRQDSDSEDYDDSDTDESENDTDESNSETEGETDESDENESEEDSDQSGWGSGDDD